VKLRYQWFGQGVAGSVIRGFLRHAINVTISPSLQPAASAVNLLSMAGRSRPRPGATFSRGRQIRAAGRSTRSRDDHGG
jgi:hypothetical protein